MTERVFLRPGRSEAVDVLAAAFHDYPVMRFVLKDAGAAYDERLRALVGFFCDVRLTRDFPLVGLREDGALVAVAGINDPEPGPWPPALQAAWQATGNALGRDAFDRLARFEAASAASQPTTPHYFLGIIGVRPAYQGQGFARALIDELIRMSDAHPRSTGIYLTTEHAANLPVYRRFGFEVIDEHDVEGLHTWAMFRANR